ncbi:ATP-grasp domain-containing protein [Actinoplanes sp. NPDC049118]|uniref:ATP-grasp domain-containing protein n=1 Tax=Actinoplanes sp. NPDC049118 TaxID=3155769 RepID=UPI0033E68072
MSHAPPKAFILTGAFSIICRNPRYLTELAARGLKILVITGEAWREPALAGLDTPGHPAAAIDEIAFVEGDFNVEGAFIAGTVAAAQQWRQRYTIVGVQSAGETVVEATGLLADALGLPTPGLRATRACRSKYLQRWYLPQFSPPSVVLPAARRAAFDGTGVRFPAVVKPAARHSSSGVVAVRDSAELLEQLAGYPAHETVLVEDKVVGQEFSVECLVQDGTTLLASVTRKETTEAFDSTFVEVAHSVPHHVRGECDALLQANQRMLTALAFEDGVVHAEWRLDDAGRPFLMEVAARTPGGGLMVLYELVTGVPLEPEIIRIALGEPASYPAPRRYARQVYLRNEPGILEDVTVDWPGVQATWTGDNGPWPRIPAGHPDDPPTLRAVLVLKDRGAALEVLRSAEDRAVTFFIDAATPEDLDQLERRVRDAVKVHTVVPAGQPTGATR